MNVLSQNIARQLRPDRPFHLSPGAQAISSTVTLHLDGVAATPEIVITDTRRDYTWAVAMQREGDMRWSTKIKMPIKPTVLTYYFRVGHHQIYEYRQKEGGNRPIYGEWREKPFKIAVYDPQRMPSEWTKGMLMYQIFPDRFATDDPDRELTHGGVYGHDALFKEWGETPEAPPLGRDFFGGNLRGIIEKLDYLKELGVECIYLNPIFEAITNHRYEAIDFLKIDPMLGTDDDFDELIRKAHKLRIRVILDAVYNHCSSDSIYFDITGKHERKDGIVGASQSQDSPYYRWFNFKSWPSDYDGWLGFGFMPEFVESPEMEDYFIGHHNSVTSYWLDRGIDGWRVDVAHDNTDEFWRRFRDCVDANKPGAYLVSEEWRDATHYLLGDTFNGTMNYRFAWAVRGFLATDSISAAELDDRLMTWIRDTPAPALHSQMNLLDSHDTDRLMTVCNNDERRYKQCIAFLLSYVGAPALYYGTETGLIGSYAEDGRRTMPWDDLNEELVDFCKTTVNLRNGTSALRLGEVETAYIHNDDRAYVFKRSYKDELVFAAFNASEQVVTIKMSLEGAPETTYTDLLELNGDIDSQNGQLTFTLQPRSMAWYTPVID